MKEIFWKHLFSFICLLNFSTIHFVSAEDTPKSADLISDEKLISSMQKPVSSEVGWSLFHSKDSDENRYVINFNNVSIIEYIRFINKITGFNFVFEETDLQFSVTIVSEEPITIKNILSALVQTLRIHNLKLLQQDHSFLITGSPDVTQLPPAMNGEKIDEEKNPIITRVLRIRNSNISSIASILKPMVSKAAILETINESKQIIITDIATNIENICNLLQLIDAPHSLYEIDSYKAKHLPLQTLIRLSEQIISPLKQGNELIFVPQGETNTIYLISTPYLIERAVEILEDLDTQPKNLSEVALTNERIFLYKIQAKSAKELTDALEQIADDLEDYSAPAFKLIAALKNVKTIKHTNSLLFITDSDTEAKIIEILKTLDSPSAFGNFFIYKLRKGGREQVENSLKELAKSIKKSDVDRDLVEAIHTMKYIDETNSLIFTGTDEALKKLSDLLPTFDTAASDFSPSSHYWLYTPQYLSGKELEAAMDDIKKNLTSSGLSDHALLNTIKSMKWVPSTNTLLFTGDPNSLGEVQAMIKLIDVATSSPSQIFIYQPKYVSRDRIEEALDELTEKLDPKNLGDRNLAFAIDKLSWIKESQSFLFKADPSTIEKLRTFLADIDSVREGEVTGQAFFLYDLKYADGHAVIDHLDKIAKNLSEEDPDQNGVIQAIDDITYLKDTNSLLLTGSPKSIEEVKKLIGQIDSPESKATAAEKTSFFIYKPLHLSSDTITKALKETAKDLKSAGLIDQNLLQSIESVRYVETTDSLVFTGTEDSLEKTKAILKTIDAPSSKEFSLGEIAGQTFLIYKVQHASINVLLSLLKNIAHNLQKTDPHGNRLLVQAIENAKVIKETKSILFTGPASTLEKINAILKQLDVPSGVPADLGQIGREANTFVIYQPQYVKGDELISIMGDFEQNLKLSGVRDPGLFETIDNLKYLDKKGYILISGDQTSVAKVEELLKKFDVPTGEEGALDALTKLQTSFLVYKLHYHSGAEIQTALKQIAQEMSAAADGINKNLISAINSVQWIKITNSLLATGTPDVLNQLKELIESVDVPLRQVFIEVLIIQTTLGNSQDFGLQWGGKVQYLSRFAGSFNNFQTDNPLPTSPTPVVFPLQNALSSVNATRTPVATDIPAPSTSLGGFDLGIIGDIILHKGRSFLSLASLVSALQTDTDSVIVMNPKIIGQDNKQSTIFVGENIPFVGSLVQTTSFTSQTASNIEYRDVGLNLTITPILGTDDIVTLDIANDITSQVANTTTGVSGVQGLQTSHTSLSARVHIPNNHFVALSGMLRDEKAHFKAGIPCIGGLPLIGAFFSNVVRNDNKNNIIFFIRPSIIDSVEEYKKITQHQEELFKEQSILPVIKEEIDEGINIVKTPEDESSP
ncbi:MAG: hypothetical protein L0207_00185 [Chlamydiae bacterium]|nr:hypothetical protein [Chlamydiota bacterium]